MALALRFLAVTTVTLLACASAMAQKPVAPEPHLALDELVKEYKRLGLPLPQANAELVRVHLLRIWGGPDVLGFRIPPMKPGESPKYLVGSDHDPLVSDPVPFKPGSDLPEGVEPEYVSDLLCLAVQCRERGLNAFAELLYARAREAIETPVPARMGGLGGVRRVNGWELREEDTSVLKELRSMALEYWHEQITKSDSDRKEVLRYLKVVEPRRT